MELNILDSLLRRSTVVDDFESLIWTPRYSDVGDFEMDIRSTPGTRNLLRAGTMCVVNNSDRVMTVETVEDSDSSDGKEMLKVKGSSLEEILKYRIAKYSLSDLTTEPTWNITDTPGNIARTMFTRIMRMGALSPNDIIPFLQPGTTYPAGTNPETTTPITVRQAPDSLYAAIKGVCDPYDLGFRLYRDTNDGLLYFEIYTGNDLTTRQTLKTPVIFGPAFDNIQNTTELITIKDSKNVAFVFGASGYHVVYGENVDTGVYGFDRRVLVVNSSVPVDDPSLSTKMIEEGTQALNNARSSYLFDGEINHYNQYQYGIDYDLGDIVELRNKDGIVTYKRVTEAILVSDSEGDRSYPTLTGSAFLGANVWADWNNDFTTWQDLNADTTSTWATQ